MSKSIDSPQGTVLRLDDPKVIEKKFKRAVTDNDAEVRFDPATKPGVSNLLSILPACTGDTPDALAGRYSQYGPLKSDAAVAVIELLTPVQERYAELAGDLDALHEVLNKGDDKARAVAADTRDRAQRSVEQTPEHQSQLR